MRLTKISFLLFAIVFTMFSCIKGGSDLNVEISPEDKSLVDLASTIYDETVLSEIVKFNGSLNELNEEYPVECLREEDGIYRVSYLGEERIAVLQFDSSCKKLSGNVYSARLKINDFGNLVIGQSLAEVKTIDPNGVYLFLYTGRSDTPKVSSHYTKDGYFISIEYDASNIIISISKKMI